ncbi:hypothetical protein [Vibrio jasicida]|uniref:hypothetical protein n=1 Tax=Vibrio jasicida TaxID=766224 RepID=UPI0005EF511E|nr:hypothetical protein [Vibrio jasicida]
MLQFMKKWRQAYLEDKAERQIALANEIPTPEPGVAIMKDLFLSCFDEKRIQESIESEIEEENQRQHLRSQGHYI